MAFPSYDFANRLATGVRRVGEKGGLVGLAAERMGKTVDVLGRAKEAYMENLAVPYAKAVGTVAFGLPGSSQEDRRLQAEAAARTPELMAAAKKIPATEPTSAAAAQPPPKEPGAPLGPETAKTANAGEDAPGAEAAPKRDDYYERVKAIKMPNGKIVFTNVPGELVKKGGTYENYGAAVEQVTGRPYAGGTNVIESSGGYKAYVQPGQETKVAAAIPAPVPTLEAALPELSDPQAIQERRDFLAKRAAEQAAAESGALALERQRAETTQAVAASQIDPMDAARLAAEARYGGTALETEAEAAKVALTQRLIDSYNQEVARITGTMPAGPEREAALTRLENDIKLRIVAIRPQAASGLLRPDPFAAFAAQPAAPVPPAK
jgi:hypothetical protein